MVSWYEGQCITQLEAEASCLFLHNFLQSTLLSANICLSLFQEGVKTENNEHINLKVAGQDGSVVQFKIKRHTPLSKLMKAYCERQVGVLLKINPLWVHCIAGSLKGGSQTGDS